jgi:cytochrome c556
MCSRRASAIVIATVLLAGAGSVATAQKTYPIFTQDDFVKFMKTVGQNFGAVNASVGSGDFESAKSQLTRSREQLAWTVTFWRDRRKDDALKYLKDTLSKMDALDEALSEEKIDPGKVGVILKDVNASCESCHAVYREYNAATRTYRFKAGSIP